MKIKRPSNKLDYIRVRLVKIIEVKGKNTFKLKLLKNIRIYLVFYVSLLEPAPTSAKLETVELDKEA